uniref:anthranilate synthase n=1 Tax=Ignisphaera aggregans TaxID=334771 RepID=A0A7J3MX42_9CREN
MELILVIDNYDSFVYNIAQIVSELGAIAIVVRNDEISLSAIDRINPDKIIISPGPGTPEKKEDIGISLDIIKRYCKSIPILGICLGHQVIGYAFGAKIRRARTIMHGKIDTIKILNEDTLLKGIPKIIKATRYNSLVIDNVSKELVIDAISLNDGEIMAIHHVEYPIYGLQFHPESIGTEHGKQILKNFIDMV